MVDGGAILWLWHGEAVAFGNVAVVQTVSGERGGGGGG